MLLSVEPVSILDWLGAALGIFGAVVLAMRMPWSGWGWVLFLFANVFWILYGVMTSTWSIVLMQGVMSVTSVLGIYRWFFVRA